MHQDEPTVVHDRAELAAERAQADAAYDPVEGAEEWEDDPQDTLPRRPRRRLLKPLPLALMAVLLIACGFVGGVLVEKGETSSGSTSSSSLASRFAALRGGASAGSTRTGASGAGGAGSFFGSGTRPTAGQVAYLDGSTLYVTNTEGNTIKVTTSVGTAVTKTVTSAVKDIHPGETVTVTGAAGSGGTIGAESISVGSSSGGLASLFGGGGGSSSSTGSSAGGSSGGAPSGGPALFGGG